MKNSLKITSACAALAVAAGLGILAFKQNRHSDEVPTVEEAVTSASEPATQEPATMPVLSKFVPSEEGMTERAKLFLAKNKDIAGWIKIDKTDVDYPFTKDPGEIEAGNLFYGGQEYDYNYYYLSHGLSGEYRREGTLFMDWRDNFGSDDDSQSENIIIYGHNMANNTMFGSIRRYRQDYSFFEQAPFIELSSNYRDYDYVICACIITSGNWYTDFVYWDMEELDSEEEFNFYMNSARSRQLFDTGVDVKYGDKLLTLSTCYADEDNSRFLVIARRLRDGEVAGDLSTVQRTEEYIKAHTPTEPVQEETN